MKGLVAV